MNPVMLAIAPWSVGPAPSAHPVSTGITVEAGVSQLNRDPGARLGVTVAPHERLWFELTGAGGSTWAMCPDCRVLGAQARGRALLIKAPAASVGVWGTAMTSNGPIEGLAGVAAEVGSERVRIDTSWPLVSSWSLLSTLRIVPEFGVTSRWSEQHRTRLSLVGVEPGVAVEHRAALGRAIVGTVGARVGEEGPGAFVSVRWAPQG